jgi:type IV pilus assembly protein PilQ
VAFRGPGFQGGSETTRGSIQVDTRTNSLIVRDTATNLEKIARLIKELDTQTPQILIEAKFVEVSEQKNRDIQGKLFLTTREFDAATSQLVFNGNRSNAGAVFGGKEFISGPPLPTSFSVTPTSGAAFGFSPKNMGILPPGLRDIAAYLGILEFESSSKIIASPRVITQNKETAEISQGKAIQLAVPAGPNVAGGFQTINATLTLQVTPQVTSDGSINMKISFSQSTPSEAPAGSSFATNTKKVDTTVLVESGATLVIGGIYTSTETKSAGGIPFLRDLPLIGVLFGSKSSLNEKGEVFIFITPRILNEKEAGFQG